MSSYIVNPEHCAALAWYGSLQYKSDYPVQVRTARTYASTLMQHNIDGVRRAYSHKLWDDNELPGLYESQPFMIAAASDQAEAYVKHNPDIVTALSAIDILCILSCYKYQCDTSAIDHPGAASIMQRIRSRAIQALSPLAAVPWEFVDPNPCFEDTVDG